MYNNRAEVLVVTAQIIAYYSIAPYKNEHRRIGTDAALSGGPAGIHEQMLAGTDLWHDGFYIVGAMVEKYLYYVGLEW